MTFSQKVKLAFAAKFAWRLLAPFFVPLFLLTARRVHHKADERGGYNGRDRVIPRYKLHPWLEWAETPDKHLPGGLYEEDVAKIYDRFGWFITAWYWIGKRNVGQGITWKLGKPVDMWFHQMSEADRRRNGVWRREEVFGPFKILTGWKVVPDIYTPRRKNKFWAHPRLSIRLNRE